MLEEMSSVVLAVGDALTKMRYTDAIKGDWQGSQLKTKADMLAHEMMSDLLAGLNAKIPVVSEEDALSHGLQRPHKYWLIDPIDGTASFAEGFSGFVTQVALVVDGEPVFAAIYAPALNQLYLARRGGGATLNGEVLRVPADRGELSLIDNYPEPRGIAETAFTELGFTKYIECGGISLKICRVADGSADVFLKDVTVRDWDLAAPHLVLQEAGGSLMLANGAEVEYKGDFEKVGMIATRSEYLCNKVAAWFTAR